MGIGKLTIDILNIKLCQRLIALVERMKDDEDVPVKYRAEIAEWLAKREEVDGPCCPNRYVE